MKKLKIVFMGTPGFAVGVLESLVGAGCDVVGVVTAPDRPAGRGRQLMQSAVKDYVVGCSALSGALIMQPEKLREEGFLEELRGLGADLFIVVAFRMLPEVVWAMPRCGTFNLHASLLPDYRGAAPINWAIMNGEVRTGVTTFFLNDKIDCGEVILQRECDILPVDNVGTLHDKLMEIGSGLVVETVGAIANGSVQTRAQALHEIAEKSAPKLFKPMMELVVEEGTDVLVLHNKVRGLSPYPAAWTVVRCGGRSEVTAKVFVTHVEYCDSALCGEWQTDGSTYLRVGAIGGWLYVDELQPQNKKRMSVVDFLRGWR